MDKQERIEKIKEIEKIKDELAELMLGRLKENPKMAKRVLVGTLEQLVESIESKEPLIIFKRSLEKNISNDLVDIDMLQNFFVFCAKAVDDEDWDEFVKESAKVFDERINELEDTDEEVGEEPEEESFKDEYEDELKLVDKINKILEEIKDDD